MVDFAHKHIRVLVIDDMAALRESVALLMKGIGFTVVNQADNGKSAIRKLELAIEENAPYGLIMSDINMPELNGIDLVKKLKADDRFKNIPVVMISTENESITVLEAIQAGAINYILKPFTSETLKKKMKEIEKHL